MEVNVLKGFSGDDEPIQVEFRAPNDLPIDLVAAGISNIEFSVKDDDDREVIYKDLIGGGIAYDTDGTDGRVNILLLQDDTYSLHGKYNYDIQITKDSKISTVVKSFFIVVKDVNERAV